MDEEKSTIQSSIVSFIGYSKSGKTASIESIITHLTAKNVNCIAFKHIHRENFTIDTPGKNTWRYSQAGAKIVTSQCDSESAVIFNWKVNPIHLIPVIEKMAEIEHKFNDQSPVIVLMEGYREIPEKKILCVKKCNEIEPQLDPTVIAISGAICSDKLEKQHALEKFDLPIINLLECPESLVQML
jgi:molybdopterin-guanine dinucleotide biosynthesis adapter protein